MEASDTVEALGAKHSVDQIFDRLGRLVKSWATSDDTTSYSGKGSRSGDPDLDAAMSELDDFLDSGRSAEAEAALDRERREREARAREEKARQSRTPPPTQGPDPIAAAYATLGLAYGAPLAEIKAAYKKLLFRYHPDRNSGSPAEMKRATEISAKINEAYTTLEAWKGPAGSPRA